MILIAILLLYLFAIEKNSVKFNFSEMGVYFCNVDNCEMVLNELLNSANKSIHCAFYNINLESTLRALNDKNKIIDVKLVVDKSNGKLTNRFQFLKSIEGRGLMHNKFCIIDDNLVMTGSYNPTKNNDDNNIVIINSYELSQNYEDEFNELRNGISSGGKQTKNPLVKINNITIENYFCPEDSCAEKVNEELISAKNNIYFMAYSFTHPMLATTLVLKSKENITIKGIMEKSQNNQYSKYDLFTYQGLDVIWDNKPWLMHHKVFIIDNETVITGSFNPTKNADGDNDENILIIHDKRIAGLFLEEFERIRHS